MTVPTYHINVFFSEEDAGWIADVPDLRHCSAYAATPELAVAEVQKAIQAWLDTARSEGRPIPDATYRPAPA
jgi:predicted RNase H-like HicB family nuclease